MAVSFRHVALVACARVHNRASFVDLERAFYLDYAMVRLRVVTRRYRERSRSGMPGSAAGFSSLEEAREWRVECVTIDFPTSEALSSLAIATALQPEEKSGRTRKVASSSGFHYRWMFRRVSPTRRVSYFQFTWANLVTNRSTDLVSRSLIPAGSPTCISISNFCVYW